MSLLKSQVIEKHSSRRKGMRKCPWSLLVVESVLWCRSCTHSLQGHNICNTTFLVPRCGLIGLGLQFRESCVVFVHQIEPSNVTLFLLRFNTRHAGIEKSCNITWTEVGKVKQCVCEELLLYEKEIRQLPEHSRNLQQAWGSGRKPLVLSIHFCPSLLTQHPPKPA